MEMRLCNDACMSVNNRSVVELHMNVRDRESAYENPKAEDGKRSLYKCHYHSQKTTHYFVCVWIKDVCVYIE